MYSTGRFKIVNLGNFKQMSVIMDLRVVIK